MTKEQIIDKYPNLYKDGKIPLGFSCGEGWHQIIDELSAKLTDLFNTIPLLNHPNVMQIKEKFGSLRYYISHQPPEISEEVHKLISECETKSETVCEQCGQSPANTKQNDRGWLKTLCPSCAAIWLVSNSIEDFLASLKQKVETTDKEIISEIKEDPIDHLVEKLLQVADSGDGQSFEIRLMLGSQFIADKGWSKVQATSECDFLRKILAKEINTVSEKIVERLLDDLGRMRGEKQ